MPLLLPPVAAPVPRPRVVSPDRRPRRLRRRRRRPGSATAPSRTRGRRAGAPTATRGSSRSSTPRTRRGLPVLGICRGMQLMAVHARRLARPAHARPGRSRDALPRRRRLRRRRRGDRAPGSRLAALVGATVEVSCHHHQSVASTRASRRSARATDGHARGDGGHRRPLLPRRAVAPGDPRRDRADGGPGRCGPRARGRGASRARVAGAGSPGSVSTSARAMPRTMPIELAATSRGSDTRPGISRWTFSIIEVSTMPAASATSHSRVPTRSSRNTPSGTKRPMLARNSIRSTLSRLVSGSRSG